MIPIFVLFFVFYFVYTLLRAIKTAFIVTAEGSGAEVIYFLKILGVLPGAVLLTYIFTKLINFSNVFPFVTIITLSE